MAHMASHGKENAAVHTPVCEGKGMPVTSKFDSPAANTNSPAATLCSEWSGLLPIPMRNTHSYLTRRFSLAEPLSEVELAENILPRAEREGEDDVVGSCAKVHMKPAAAAAAAAAAIAPTTTTAPTTTDTPPVVVAQDATPSTMLKGKLMKLKRSSGGKAAWNKRWFQMEGGELSYYRAEDCPTRLGWMPLDRILSVTALDPLVVIPGT